jgi:putative hydrolase of the HAD superfamily
MKAIIFDLDNTLYEEKQYFLEVFRVFAKKHGLDFPSFEAAFTDELQLHSKDWLGDTLKGAGKFTPEYQEELFALYRTINAPVKIYEDAKELIAYARSKKLKLGVVTNGALEAQENKVRCLKLDSLVDAIVFARKFGKENEKPGRMPYEAALKELDVTAPDSLYIGDNPNTDIAGAKALKFKTVWVKRGYHRNSQCTVCDYAVENLRELITRKIV